MATTIPQASTTRYLRRQHQEGKPTHVWSAHIRSYADPLLAKLGTVLIIIASEWAAVPIVRPPGRRKAPGFAGSRGPSVRVIE